MNTALRKTSDAQKMPESKVARFLSAQIDICDLSQREISDRLGYRRPNIITMFKQGLTKLPIEKVRAMADVLGVDPLRLLDLVMREYSPSAWDEIQKITGYAVTANEFEMVKIIRAETGEEDPKLRTAAQKKALRTFAKTLSI